MEAVGAVGFSRGGRDYCTNAVERILSWDAEETTNQSDEIQRRKN